MFVVSDGSICTFVVDAGLSVELKVSFLRLKGWKLEEGMFILEIHAYEVIVQDLLNDNLLAVCLEIRNGDTSTKSVAFCIEWAPIVILDLADGRSELKFVSTVGCRSLRCKMIDRKPVFKG